MKHDAIILTSMHMSFCLCATLHQFDRVLQESQLSASQLNAIAVCAGPGLAPCLRAGVEWSKNLFTELRALPSSRIRLLGVNHMMAHMYTAHLEATLTQMENIQLQPPITSHFRFPLLSLLISGGHTELWHANSLHHTGIRILGRTADDAAGEAGDKAARIIGIQRKTENEAPGTILSYAYFFMFSM